MQDINAERTQLNKDYTKNVHKNPVKLELFYKFLYENENKKVIKLKEEHSNFQQIEHQFKSFNELLKEQMMLIDDLNK